MNKIYNVKEIVFPPFIIRIKRDGIYRINIYTKESVKIFEGEFRFISYKQGEHEDIYKIMRNNNTFMGNFKKLMKELRPYRGQRLDSFKKIFNHYKREFEKELE